MATRNSTTTAAQNSHDDWPAYEHELCALRDALLADAHDAGVQWATRQDAARCALGQLDNLLAFAADWDAGAEAARVEAQAWADLLARAEIGQLGDDIPSVPPVPTPVPLNAAQRKAAYHLSRGLDIRRGAAGWFVPSGTRGSVIHLVGDDGRCSCEAGTKGQACWHVAAVAHQTATQTAQVA